MMLIIGIYFLRLSGQGMMYHVYSTAVTRRYLQVRGRALAISGFGMNAAEALFPIVAVLGLGVFDWRLIWIMLPFLPLSALPLLSPILPGALIFRTGRGARLIPPPARQKIKMTPIHAARTGYKRQRLLGGDHLADDGTGLYSNRPVFSPDTYRF